MLLEDLAAFKTSAEAAKAFVGNWLKWDHFVWFGRDDVPNSQNMALGYVVGNHEYTAVSVANLRSLKRLLKEHWGDTREGAAIGDFGSSFHGDKNFFNGLQVRVIDDAGEVTKAFKLLWALARKAKRDCGHIDFEEFKKVDREMLRALVERDLEDKSAEFIDAVTDCLLNEEEIGYDDVELGEDGDIERVASQIVLK